MYFPNETRPYRLALLSILLAATTLASAQEPQMRSSRFKAPPERTLVLICNTANDFFVYEVSADERYALQGLTQLPPPLLLQDRDAFPAAALLAYDTLTCVLGLPRENARLLLYHDDEPGNSGCEVPIRTPDDDQNGDEWISHTLPSIAATNALYGCDGVPASGDEPLIEHETLVQGDGGVTKANLRSALDELARRTFANDKIFIYLIDHGADEVDGGSGALYFEDHDPADPEDDFVTGTELDQWLDESFSNFHLPKVMTLLVDCCYAEAFLQPILAGAGQGTRIGVASSAWNRPSLYHLESMFYPALFQAGPQTWPVYPGFGPVPDTPAGSVFFWPFWQHVALGASVYEACDRAVNFRPTPIWLGNSTVLELQRPVLVDPRFPSAYTSRTVTTSAQTRWRDFEWRPQGDYALVVGDGGLIAQYRWNQNLAGFAGDYELVTLSQNSAFPLYQVCWSVDGQFALAVGAQGQVYHVDHQPFGPLVTQIGAQAPFQTTTWYGDAATPPTGPMNLDDGIDMVLVGSGGAIGLYDAQTMTVAAAAVQGNSTQTFYGCDVNPLMGYAPPDYPCDFDEVWDEVLVAGQGGAWRYEYRNGWRDSNCGTTTSHAETLVQVLADAQLGLRRVKWQPHQQDEAVCVGWRNGSGAIARIGANNQWTTQLVSEVDALYDVDFDPDGEYVVCGGMDLTVLRVELDQLADYQILMQSSTFDVMGIDWRSTNTQVTAAAMNPDVTFGVVTLIEEIVPVLGF